MYRYNASDKPGSYFIRPARTKPDRSIGTRFFDQVFTWLDRARQRRHLGELDDRLLRDIGLSRADVEHEVSQPFWQSGRN
jgi:uncharacterized protein YjiS (DUF1127 family)